MESSMRIRLLRMLFRSSATAASERVPVLEAMMALATAPRRRWTRAEAAAPRPRPPTAPRLLTTILLPARRCAENGGGGGWRRAGSQHREASAPSVRSRMRWRSLCPLQVCSVQGQNQPLLSLNFKSTRPDHVCVTRFLGRKKTTFTSPSGRATPPRQPPLPLCGRSCRNQL
eukprot:COSAG06_NODE_6349_length_2973_cov_6.280445_1_plen_171_part_10